MKYALLGKKSSQAHTQNYSLNQLIAWNSRAVVIKLNEEKKIPKHRNRVALLKFYIRAYFSHGRNCKHCKNCKYDCKGWFLGQAHKTRAYRIRGPCRIIRSQMKESGRLSRMWQRTHIITPKSCWKTTDPSSGYWNVSLRHWQRSWSSP